MSSFTRICRNKKTGELVSVFFWDDYHGRHCYGYQIALSGPVLTEEEFSRKYEVVEDNAPAQKGGEL